MAKNIRAKGFPLTVLAHRNRQPVDDLVSRGAKEAATAADLARESDVVILCVTGSPQVEDVLNRPGGLLEGMHPGLVVVDSSTGDPDFAVRAEAAVRARGGIYIDAPVNRTPKEAEEGRLNVLVGGDAAVVEDLRPVLASYSETIHHLGPIGSGHKAKLIHNFIAQGNAVILAEAFAAAAKVGLDLRSFADLCRLSGAHSRTFDRLIPFVLEGDDSNQKFALRNAVKDMRSYTHLAEMAPATAFVAQAVHQTFVLATALGHGDKYIAHLFDVMGEINGTHVRAD
ncbi:NAD(P)-dependent oxidoreductase [Microvirga sp. M2]|uniref:NAD(P)-dependent oxidoreductase n=1 Tax=Microvirga sp. M2 TaxID=3073270 RepID=UPI0039C42052